MEPITHLLVVNYDETKDTIPETFGTSPKAVNKLCKEFVQDALSVADGDQTFTGKLIEYINAGKIEGGVLLTLALERLVQLYQERLVRDAHPRRSHQVDIFDVWVKDERLYRPVSHDVSVDIVLEQVILALRDGKLVHAHEELRPRDLLQEGLVVALGLPGDVDHLVEELTQDTLQVFLGFRRFLVGGLVQDSFLDGPQPVLLVVVQLLLDGCISVLVGIDMDEARTCFIDEVTRLRISHRLLTDVVEVFD